MSDLIVMELGDSLSEFNQELTATSDLNIQAVRLHLYRHNNASGNVTVEVRDSNGKVISTSNTITITNLVLTGGAGLNFVHGWFKFDIDAHIKSGSVFQIALTSGGGYSFAEASYVGWVKDNVDWRRYTVTYASGLGTDSPYDLELWTLQDKGRQVV